MFKVTRKYISNKFDEFNRDLFNGEIRKTHLVVGNNECFLGQFRPKTWTIEISKYWERTEAQYLNTLLHEMAHVYVRQKYGHLVMPHGDEWKSMVEVIGKKTNAAYGAITEKETKISK